MRHSTWEANRSYGFRNPAVRGCLRQISGGAQFSPHLYVCVDPIIHHMPCALVLSYPRFQLVKSTIFQPINPIVHPNLPYSVV